MKPFEFAISLLDREFGHNLSIVQLPNFDESTSIEVTCKKCNITLYLCDIGDLINDFIHNTFFTIIDSGRRVRVLMIDDDVYCNYNKITCDEVMIKNILE